MAILRFLSGSIEIFAGALMIKFNEIEKALVINSSLALVGPMVLLATTTIGLIGMTDRLSLSKIFLIFLGVAIIIYAIRK